MRKIAAVFLLMVFLINLAGVFIVFEIQRSLIHNEVIQLLECPEFEEELTVIMMTLDNTRLFEWEDEKEFRYNNMIYDVVKKEINAAGESVYHCFADKKETRLWSNLSEMVKKNSPSHETINNLVKLLSSVFIPAEKNFISLFQKKSFLKTLLTDRLLFNEDEVLSPPPRLG
jgi:hypothetical protein